jgi:hypothetical protein
MADSSSDPRTNHLLAALPAADLKRWLPDLEWFNLPLGEVIYESGKPQTHVHFPTTAIVSLLYVMESGARRKSPSSATKASSASRSSWVESRRRAGPWRKAPARAFV